MKNSSIGYHTFCIFKNVDNSKTLKRIYSKFEKYKKKRNQQMLKNGRYKISYARFRSDSLSYSLCYLIITAGIIFIYNRLNGNLPNIIELIKEFASYWIKIMGIV